jgi:hypothetical protein
MSRKLKEDFIVKFLKGGEYYKLMQEVRADKELSVEIRTKSEIKIYYCKGLILTLTEKGAKILSSGYFKGLEEPIFNPSSPKEYLSWAKRLVRQHSNKVEFTIQQNIATSNQSKEAKYFVVDMEWQFPQSEIKEENRLPKSRIDIVAIERSTNDIVLFELKQGDGALDGNSGVKDHLRKSNKLIQDPRFRNKLQEDVKSIIEDKKALGLIDYELPETFGNIKQMFIFAYDTDTAYETYKRNFASMLEAEGVKTLYIDTRYRLL